MQVKMPQEHELELYVKLAFKWAPFKNGKSTFILIIKAPSLTKIPLCVKHSVIIVSV